MEILRPPQSKKDSFTAVNTLRKKERMLHPCTMNGKFKKVGKEIMSKSLEDQVQLIQKFGAD